MPISVAQAGELTLSMVRMVRLMKTMVRQGPRRHDSVDPATQPLLFILQDRPLRVSDLADLSHSEVSTVSRHISNFERAGLVLKVADAEDRRASQVSLSDTGHQLVQRLRAAHAERMCAVLTDWDPQDAATLAALLTRLADDVERSLHSSRESASRGRR